MPRHFWRCAAVPALWLAAGCAPSGAEKACCLRPSTTMASTNSALSTRSLYGQPFVWETDTGEQIRLSELRDRPRIVTMFFASCEGSCVLTLEHLRAIEASLPTDIRERVGFVMVTFDPDRDTAKALAAYRSERHLPIDRWTLLRGSSQATTNLAASLGTQFIRNSPRGIVHTTEIAVVDETGNIVDSQSGTHPDLNRTIAALHAAMWQKPVARSADR